jgi:hypothetical protein
MKPKFLSACLMLFVISFSAFAQKSSVGDPVSKTVKLDEPFTSLLIASDLPVILTEGDSNNIVVEGDARDIKKVGVSIVDDRLTLTDSRPQARPDVKVYVPATFLNKVYVNGKANLSSSSVLHNKNLKIFLSEEAIINVKSFGKVTVETTSEIDFVASLQSK